MPPALARAFQLDAIAQPVAPGLIDAVVDESLRAPAHVWRAAFSALFDDHFSDELARVQAPTLIAWGDADAFVPAEDTAALSAAIARSRVSAYAGSGHALHWEQPARDGRSPVAHDHAKRSMARQSSRASTGRIQAITSRSARTTAGTACGGPFPLQPAGLNLVRSSTDVAHFVRSGSGTSYASTFSTYPVEDASGDFDLMSRGRRVSAAKCARR